MNCADSHRPSRKKVPKRQCKMPDSDVADLRLVARPAETSFPGLRARTNARFNLTDSKNNLSMDAVGDNSVVGTGTLRDVDGGCSSAAISIGFATVTTTYLLAVKGSNSFQSISFACN